MSKGSIRTLFYPFNQIDMKILFISLFFTCFSILGKAQTIDSASIIIRYKLSYLSDSSKPQKASTDIMQLCIGDKISTFYSYIGFRSDSAIKNDMAEGKITLQDFSKNPELRSKYPSPGLLNKYQLYINYPENKITTTDNVFTSKYLFEEKMGIMKWTVLEDTMNLSGYNCQKATTNFKGRSYIAWFTSELPWNEGPYKFRGLPGLILKIEDTKKNFIFECIEIQRLHQKEPIVLNNKDFIKTSRAEYRKLLKAGFDNPYQVLIADHINNITLSEDASNYFKATLQKPLPYNPIELE
jgi:GLPGLI family protein